MPAAVKVTNKRVKWRTIEKHFEVSNVQPGPSLFQQYCRQHIFNLPTPAELKVGLLSKNYSRKEWLTWTHLHMDIGQLLHHSGQKWIFWGWARWDHYFFGLYYCMISANFPNVQDSLCGIPWNMQGFNQFFSRTWLVYVSKNKCKSSSTRVYLAICTKYVHVQRKSKNRVYVRVYLHLTHDTWPTLIRNT